MKTLSFSYDALFTVATDDLGRSYRVLREGNPDGSRTYILEPQAVYYPPDPRAVGQGGKRIGPGHRLHPAIAAADAGCPEPISTGRRRNRAHEQEMA